MTTLRALSRICVCILLTVLVLARTAIPAAAEDLLVIRNATDPAQAEVRFSEADLLALPQVTIRTRTEFTDGVVEFIGPLARDAVAFIDAGAATTVHLVAANDYAIDIPLSDLLRLEVGDVIPLGVQAGGQLDLVIEEVPCAKVRWGRHDGRLAVRIDQLEGRLAEDAP